MGVLIDASILIDTERGRLDLAARAHARTWADLAAADLRIGPHDLWLAAICIAHGLTLITANARAITASPARSARPSTKWWSTVSPTAARQEQPFEVGAVVLAEAAVDERRTLPADAHAHLIRVLPAEADAGGVGVRFIEAHAELARHGDHHVRDECLVNRVTGR